MTDEELTRLLAQLRLFQRRQRRERPAIGGLSRSAASVLGAVARSEGPAQPTLLARELVMTSSNVAAALRELTGAGLVNRKGDKVDTRRVVITLTAAGRRLVQRDRATRDAWLVAAVDEALTRSQQASLLAAGDLLEQLAGHRSGHTNRSAGEQDRAEATR